MNQKAEKRQLEYPLLLNMQADQPAVHEDFRSVEAINSPLIAGMHRPLFNKRTDVGNKTVVDRYDHVYQIKDGFLQRKLGNVDENLFQVANEHFVATDVTDELYKYQAVDIDNDGNYATLAFTSAANAVTLEYKDFRLTTDILFINGTILAQRIRIIDNEAIGVIVYLDDNYDFKMAYMRKKVDIIPVNWYYSIPRTTYSATFNYEATGNGGGVHTRGLLYSEVDPIISICKPKDGYIGISLVSNWGFQLNTTAEGYFTFVDKDGYYFYGSNFLPKNSTTTVEATTTIQDFFQFVAEAKEGWREQTSYDVIYGGMAGLANKWYRVTGGYDIGNGASNDARYYDDLPYQPNDNVIVPAGSFYLYTDDTSYYKFARYKVVLTKLKTRISSSHSGQTSGCSYTIKWNGDLEGSQTRTVTYDSNNVGATDITYSTWNYKGNQYIDLTSLTVTAGSKTITANKEAPYTNETIVITSTTTGTATEGWIMAPNIFMDNGNMYSLYTFPILDVPTSTTASWSQTYTNSANTKNNIVESARFEGIDESDNRYTFTIIESHTVDAYSLHPRSNSFGINQNFYCNFTKLCSNSGVISPTYLADKKLVHPGSNDEDNNAKFTEYFNSNCTDMLYFPGSMYLNNYKFYSKALEASEDVGWFHPGGFRAQLGDSKWNLMIYCQNNNDVYIQGISYSETPDAMGTLITDIASIDEDWQIAYSDNACIYKDVYGKIWKLTVEEGVELSSVLDNEFIIVNTTSYWNCWDAKNNKPYHYATDYNGRATPGLLKSEWDAIKSTTVVRATDTRAVASGINVNIQGTLDAIGSLHTPINQLQRVYRLEYYMKLYASQGIGSTYLQPIDVFFQGDGETYSVESTSDNMLDYKFSINPTPIFTRFRRGDMVEVPYTGTPVLFPTSMLAKFINGSGNNDFVMMGESTYPLLYNRTESEPLFMTSKTGEIVNATSFFVIQGQYYATIDEKLYGLTYSNGYVATRDALVDIRGMHFVGNTPQIAFFWAEKDKSFYSFTGDGILEKLFSANKYSLESFKYEYYYDESTMSIFVPTDKGILVFGSENTYLLPEFTNIDKIYFTPKYTYITDNTGYTQLAYFEEDGFKPLTIHIETSFYGFGSNSNLSIDRFDIVLYDENHKSDNIKLATRTLTDVSTQSETKNYMIGENDWDSWTHSVLISYSPKYIKGKGIKLYLDTNSAIQSITAHVTDNNSGTTTKYQM